MKNLSPLLLLCFLSACTSFNHETETQRILDLHHAQRDYHFNANTEAFARQLSDDFVSINRGRITQPSFEENFNRFDAYFNAVSFLKWDDVEEPMVRFSKDGSLAYTVVQKTVEAEYPNEEGDPRIGRTDFAWLAVYRKTQNDWKIECVASTNLPDEYPPGKEERLRMRMDQLNQAFVEADTARLAQLTTTDYVHTNGSSKPIGRDNWLAYIASRKKSLEDGSLKILNYETSDIKITLLENTAIVNARVDVEQISNGQKQQRSLQVTHIWKDEHGLWKRAGFHDGKIE